MYVHTFINIHIAKTNQQTVIINKEKNLKNLRYYTYIPLHIKGTIV